MTSLAKIMVLVNVALSLVFAFWATGVYRNRIDYQAEHTARAKTIDDLKKVLAGQGPDASAGAEVRWQVAENRLKTTEALRPVLKKLYADELDKLRTGKGGGPIQELVYDSKTGKLMVDPASGRPNFGPVLDAARQPIPGLANLATLHQNYTGVQGLLAKALEDSDKALAKVKELTAQIGDGQRTGLRFQLAEQEREEKKSLDQHEYLQPLLYNRLVEVQILTKEHKALESRLDELKATAMAVKP